MPEYPAQDDIPWGELDGSARVLPALAWGQFGSLHCAFKSVVVPREARPVEYDKRFHRSAPVVDGRVHAGMDVLLHPTPSPEGRSPAPAGSWHRLDGVGPSDERRSYQEAGRRGRAATRSSGWGWRRRGVLDLLSRVAAVAGRGVVRGYFADSTNSMSDRNRRLTTAETSVRFCSAIRSTNR